METLRVLVKNGAEPLLYTKKGYNVLHLAAYHGNLDCLDYLINVLQISPNLLSKNQLKSSCLHLACQQGHAKIVEFLFWQS